MAVPNQEVPDLEPSSVVGETYRIDHRVARGGSSLIYSARHVEMDRRVALKVLPLDSDVDASALERFSQEARLACQINHPNVVTIFQFGQDPRGLLYIAMEWLDGISLSDAIEERGTLPPERVAEIGREVARGLEAAHQHDVLHRDLKPSNVMLAQLAGWEEIAKLLDFGVAKSLAPTEEDELRITQEGKFVGTPRYAAPELIQGEELSVRTDIYATGLMMWEALVGEPAVTSVVFQKCCAQHLSDEPWRLPESVDAPDALTEVVERALRKPPPERYDSCRELAEALDRAIHEMASGRSSGPSSPATYEGGDEWTYGSQWMKLLFVLAVGLGALGLAGYQGWLSVTKAGQQQETSAESAQSIADSPDQLIEQLQNAGWRIAHRSQSEVGHTRYELQRDGATVPIMVGNRETEFPSQFHSIPFPDFTVYVDSEQSSNRTDSYRLLARLYALRGGGD